MKFDKDFIGMGSTYIVLYSVVDPVPFLPDPDPIFNKILDPQKYRIRPNIRFNEKKKLKGLAREE